MNQIFGWTVFSLIKGKKVERYRYDPELNHNFKFSIKIDFMKELRMYKSDAALSGQYLKNYYHSTTRTLDRGHMTLIKEFFLNMNINCWIVYHLWQQKKK